MSDELANQLIVSLGGPSLRFGLQSEAPTWLVCMDRAVMTGLTSSDLELAGVSLVEKFPVVEELTQLNRCNYPEFNFLGLDEGELELFPGLSIIEKESVRLPDIGALVGELSESSSNLPWEVLFDLKGAGPFEIDAMLANSEPSLKRLYVLYIDESSDLHGSSKLSERLVASPAGFLHGNSEKSADSAYVRVSFIRDPSLRFPGWAGAGNEQVGDRPLNRSVV